MGKREIILVHTSNSNKIFRFMLSYKNEVNTERGQEFRKKKSDDK